RKRWLKHFKYILRDNLIAGRAGVDAVGLHQVFGAISCHIFEQEGQEGQLVLRGKIFVDLFKIVDVIRTVVAGQRDSSKDDFGFGGLECLNRLFEVFASLFQGETAETVVAAQFEDDDGWFHGGDVRDARKASRGGISADSGV